MKSSILLKTTGHYGLLSMPSLRSLLPTGTATSLLAPTPIGTLPLLTFIRERHTKHWNPKWKKLRTKKVVKIELPNFQEKPSDLSEEQIKNRLKERGLLPPRQWMERPFFIGCTGGVFEPYVPPEGDGKLSALSRTGAKQKFEFLEKKSKSMLAIRKIRSYEEDFDSTKFAELAQDIYVKSHQLLSTKDKYAIREYVSERAYPEMMHNIKYKTIDWRFIGSLEPPKVVHARCTDIISKENIFAQVTIRFHTQQILTIYDRFGRVMHGNPTIEKDVLEYVVFEKHISNEYGQWRLHDKLVPSWMPEKEPTARTFAYQTVNEQSNQAEDGNDVDNKSTGVDVSKRDAQAIATN